MHKAWSSIEEVPYCFSMSSVKFQGHTGQNITHFDPNWPFPDYRPVAAFKSLRFASFVCMFIFSVISLSISFTWRWSKHQFWAIAKFSRGQWYIIGGYEWKRSVLNYKTYQNVIRVRNSKGENKWLLLFLWLSRETATIFLAFSATCGLKIMSRKRSDLYIRFH